MKYREKTKKKRKEKSMNELWDSFKQPTIHVIGTPKEQEMEGMGENICRNNGQNFSEVY